jgi:hypothetical protein
MFSPACQQRPRLLRIIPADTKNLAGRLYRLDRKSEYSQRGAHHIHHRLIRHDLRARETWSLPVLSRGLL